ncbi:MAG: hypothetical protein OHK0045_25650 [Raineya sp.]
MKEEKKEVLYKVSIYDTLNLQVISPSMRVINYSDKRIFLSDLMGQKIYQTDLSGKLLQELSLTGDNPQQIGAHTYGVACLGDTAIAAIGTNGLYIYDLEGKLINHYPKKISAIRGGSLARRLRIKDIWIDKTPYLICTWFSSLPNEEKSLANSRIDIFRKLKFLSVFNLQQQSYYVDLPFEKNSIFFKNDNRYDDAVCFDYNYSNKMLYSIISPDKYVHIYQVTNKKFNLKKSILLNTEEFELRKISPFGTTYDQMQIYVNSEFRTLDISEDGKYCMISYRTGIPVEEYQRAKSNAEIPQIHKNLNKRYVILLENDEQKSAPIQLPKNVKEVAYFKSPEYILLAPNDFESPNYTSFYVARLEKVQK